MSLLMKMVWWRLSTALLRTGAPRLNTIYIVAGLIVTE